MTFIPSPPLGIMEVVLRADYWYGWVDPIQWPQLHCPGFEYLCAVLRAQPTSPTLGCMWWTPREDDDFQRLEGLTIKCLGLINGARIQPLSDLVDAMTERVEEARAIEPIMVDGRLVGLEMAMRHARDRLLHFPCTFQDAALQVRELQRYWLMCHAFLDYYGKYMRPGAPVRDVDTRVMGAFTMDPSVVQALFEVGIPVWWVRHDISAARDIGIVTLKTLEEPKDICVQNGAEHGEVIYRGLIGAAHQEAMVRGGHTYCDLSRAPLLVMESPTGYPSAMSQQEYKQALGLLPASSRPKRSRAEATTGQGASSSNQHARAGHPYTRPADLRANHARGFEKFVEVEHRWMPPALKPWRAAMEGIDITRRTACLKSWGYWIPNPTMFVRTQTEDRAARYLYTWLRMRPAWLYILRVNHSQLSGISAQWWRDFLYGQTHRGEANSSTLNGKRAAQILHVFGECFKGSEVDVEPTAPPQWFARRLTRIPESLCAGIVWELCELGFRNELLTLDRLLVPMRHTPCALAIREDMISRIFPDRSVYCVASLPKEGSEGLAAALPQRRAPYLEAFRQVLSRWPRCPQSIHGTMAITINLAAEIIEEREREIVRFYVQTFYDESGRPPIVPRAFPNL